MGKTRKIIIAGKNDKIELAVNPSQIVISQKRNDKTIDLLNVGTVNIPGKRDLTYVTISTFIPAKASPFYKDGDRAPKSIVKLMRKWKNGKTKLRIIISGTNVNMLFTVQGIEDTYKEGQKDAYVSWSFVEDRSSNVSSAAAKKARNFRGLITRAGAIEIPKKVKVKSVKKDTLWNLAVKYYDDGTKWYKIADANNVTSWKKLKKGQRLVIPQ